MSLEPVDSMEAEATRTAVYAELEVLVDRQVDLPCESLLSRFTGLAEDRDWVLELIYLEYVLRTARGQTPTIEAFQLRFPQLRHDIAALLEVDSAIGVTDPAGIGSTRAERAIDRAEADASSDLSRLGRVGDYELVEVIGRGGMGVVYRAIQSRLDRAVAVKTIDAFASLDRTVTERFQSEAETVARLQHPNIVQIHEVGTYQGLPYFSMELITGGTLAQATLERPLPPETAARLLATLARRRLRSRTGSHSSRPEARQHPAVPQRSGGCDRSSVIPSWNISHGQCTASSRTEDRGLWLGQEPRIAPDAHRPWSGVGDTQLHGA